MEDDFTRKADDVIHFLRVTAKEIDKLPERGDDVTNLLLAADTLEREAHPIVIVRKED